MGTFYVRRQAGGSNLVSILVVLVFVAIFCAVVLPRYLGQGPPGPGGVRAPDTAATDAVCRSNLAAIRQAVVVYRTSHNGAAMPRSLSDLDLPASETRCPTGGESYEFTGSSGEVRCVHPGHGGY